MPMGCIYFNGDSEYQKKARSIWHLLSLQVLCRQSSTLMIMKLTLTQTGVCLVIILFAALMVRSSTVTIYVRVLIDKCRLQNDRPTNRLYKYYGIVPKKKKQDFSVFLKINIVCNYSNAWTDFRVIPLVTKWWRINQTTDFRITEKSEEIDKASHEYKNRVTSVQKLCEITNIPRSAVSDNLKRTSKYGVQDLAERKYVTLMTDGLNILLLLIASGRHSELWVKVPEKITFRFQSWTLAQRNCYRSMAENHYRLTTLMNVYMCLDQSYLDNRSMFRKIWKVWF